MAVPFSNVLRKNVFKLMMIGLIAMFIVYAFLFKYRFVLHTQIKNQSNHYRPIRGSLSKYFKTFHSNVFKYRKTKAYKEPFASDYYVEFQRAMRKLTLEVLRKDLTNPQVVVVSQFYGRDRTAPHYHDMLTSVQINLLNPFISEYHFLQEDDFNNEDIKKLIGANKKVKISIIGKRMTSGYFMQYCNEKLLKRFVILTNTDIYFDNTIAHTSKLQPDSSIMLSRRQTFIAPYLEGESRDHCIGGYVGSHDAFIFNTRIPFPSAAITKLENVPLGYYGSENVIMYYVKNNGGFNYMVRNSCKTIFVWHLHEVRGGTGGPPPRINTDEITSTEEPVENID